MSIDITRVEHAKHVILEGFEYDDSLTARIIEKMNDCGYVCEEGIQVQEWIIAHKQAFVALERLLVGDVTINAYRHDCDKLLLNGFLTHSFVGEYHDRYARHQPKNGITLQDKIDFIIDQECSRFTRPNKQTNAYEAIMKRIPNQYEEFKPLLQYMGIDSPIHRDFKFGLITRDKNRLDMNTIVAVNQIYFNTVDAKSGTFTDVIDSSVRNFYADPF